MGFKLEDIDDVRGATMVDKEGAKIGEVEDVFLDRQTGGPAWAAVKTGLLRPSDACGMPWSLPA
jgi:sporulation protein YlmC with PRC-barrel domain